MRIGCSTGWKYRARISRRTEPSFMKTKKSRSKAGCKRLEGTYAVGGRAGRGRGVGVTPSTAPLNKPALGELVPSFFADFFGTRFGSKRLWESILREGMRQMVSQMNLIQNAARLAMADHRAAIVRVAAARPPVLVRSRIVLAACSLAVVVALAAFASTAI